jgi:hypothetical protein
MRRRKLKDSRKDQDFLPFHDESLDALPAGSEHRRATGSDAELTPSDSIDSPAIQSRILSSVGSSEEQHAAHPTPSSDGPPDRIPLSPPGPMSPHAALCKIPLSSLLALLPPLRDLHDSAAYGEQQSGSPARLSAGQGDAPAMPNSRRHNKDLPGTMPLGSSDPDHSSATEQQP